MESFWQYCDIGSIASTLTILAALAAFTGWLFKRLNANTEQLRIEVNHFRDEVREDMQEIREEMKEIRINAMQAHIRIDASLGRIDKLHEMFYDLLKEVRKT